jgi:hypothetical protein
MTPAGVTSKRERVSQMADLIWVPNPQDLPKLLNRVPTLGVPGKVNREWLKSIGFKSSNHAYMPAVLGRLGFIDSSNVPTDRWKKFRDKSQQGAIMAAALHESYAELFDTYPDAENKDTEALRNFFGSRSTASDITVQRAVGTFRALAGLAQFGVPSNTETSQTPSIGSGTAAAARGVTLNRSAGLPSLNINIELHLPETDKAEVYENLFAAMKKHLLE